jgi:hypothetical protein
MTPMSHHVEADVGSYRVVQENCQCFLERLGRKVAVLIRKDFINKGFENHPAPRGNVRIIHLVLVEFSRSDSLQPNYLWFFERLSDHLFRKQRADGARSYADTSSVTIIPQCSHKVNICEVGPHKINPGMSGNSSGKMSFDNLTKLDVASRIIAR